MSFRRPVDFGLRSTVCQLVISTWADLFCPVRFNKAGPWGGRGEEAEGERRTKFE